MAKIKKEILPILLDLHYKYSMNKFEEFYGDFISYTEIEQISYIDLKDMVFEQIGKNIKFRKFGRIGNILTIKMDISTSDYEYFLRTLREEDVDEEATEKAGGQIKYKRFNFLHNFGISNIRILNREEKIKFKKYVEPLDEDDEDDEDDLYNNLKINNLLNKIKLIRLNDLDND